MATKKRDFSQYPSRQATPTITVRLSAETLEDLKEEASNLGISVSELVRKYLEAVKNANLTPA